ncbi:glycosyltransferase [Thiorhodovibrio frisius]|uniref:Glycosyltransferase n=2 Tax=Thiorhodovibrio frisius TaxID=631362 RepID=H8Z0R5_9GAMM|nr:glycosyltransferase [Thiorhodovibrio frisius]WPL23879.1 GDP-mannose-dependent alpha-(1-6)-phosphatidylinositol monomannoside mannosyltransferase [Thiorhodovibrio frisius]
MLAYRQWHGVLVGHRRFPNGLNLDGLDVRLLLADPPGWFETRQWRLNRLLGRAARRDIRLLAREKAQLFHVHFATKAVDIWPLVRALNLPMVITLHGYDINIYRDWWEAGHGGWRMRAYPRKLLALAQEPRVHFIAVSEAIRERAMAYGIPEKKITVCYIGVDTDRFKPGGLPIHQRARRVLFVGRLVEKKGATYLIDAFGQVAKEFPDAELIIVGDGPLRTQLMEKAKRVGGNIQFLGVLGSEQVREQMNLARIFCLPSVMAENGDAEGFGMVILEAQASGVPVITSAIGAKSAGVLDTEAGIQFKESDIKSIIFHIFRFFEDDNFLKEASIKGRYLAKNHFNIKICTKNLEEIYFEFKVSS